MSILAYFSRGLLYGGLATAVLYLFAREREDARALHAARLEKVSLDRQTIEAHLQALQAQIEPHFLFNTLANIKLLYETESSRARPLIHDLAEYLRTALPQMRDMRSTLARELELAQAYLRVLKVRMGERLERGDRRSGRSPGSHLAPDDVVDAGGKCDQARAGLVAAGRHDYHPGRTSGERLRVSVIDDGIGFPKGFGAGVGLANTRARLTALYGDQGRLTLAANPRGGVIARSNCPVKSPPSGWLQRETGDAPIGCRNMSREDAPRFVMVALRAWRGITCGSGRGRPPLRCFSFLPTPSECCPPCCMPTESAGRHAPAGASRNLRDLMVTYLTAAYCFLLAVSIAEYGAWNRLPPARRYVAAGFAACGAAILLEITLYTLVPSLAPNR